MGIVFHVKMWKTGKRERRKATTMTSATVEVDSRGRLSLGKIAEAGTYRATSRSDGSIVLEPAVTLTATELAALRNPQVSADLDAAFAGTLKTVPFDWRSR